MSVHVFVDAWNLVVILTEVSCPWVVPGVPHGRKLQKSSPQGSHWVKGSEQSDFGSDLGTVAPTAAACD